MKTIFKMVNKQLLLASGCLVCLTVSPVNASQLSEQRWQEFNLAAVQQHIIPNYQALAEQSSLLVTRVTAFCEDRSEQRLSAAKSQFKQTQQAWQNIQHIQFGPVTMLMRNFSLQYWPDKKNLGGRQLNALLKQASAGDAPQYNNEFFNRASVAVKGYPAIERMLFEEKLFAQLDSNPSYCPLLTAITEHIASNTQSIVTEWHAELANYHNYAEDALYQSPREAATEILKTLVEPIEAISDGKIAAPLGKTLAKMRWRKSESWRSQQSIENIRTNLKSLQHLFSGVFGASTKQLLIESGAGELAAEIDRQFSQINAALQQIAAPVAMQYQQQQFTQLNSVQQQLKKLSDNLLASMQPLQIKLGFNRRDGD